MGPFLHASCARTLRTEAASLSHGSSLLIKDRRCVGAPRIFAHNSPYKQNLPMDNVHVRLSYFKTYRRLALGQPACIYLPVLPVAPPPAPAAVAAAPTVISALRAAPTLKARRAGGGGGGRKKERGRGKGEGRDLQASSTSARARARISSPTRHRSRRGKKRGREGGGRKKSAVNVCSVGDISRDAGSRGEMAVARCILCTCVAENAKNTRRHTRVFFFRRFGVATLGHVK
jgi:hypothetical protein